MGAGLSKMVRYIATNPYLNLAAGLIFLASGIIETIHELIWVEGFKIGAHHGVVLFAIRQTLRSFTDIFEGVVYVNE